MFLLGFFFFFISSSQSLCSGKLGLSESDADSTDSIRPRKIGEMKYKGSRQAVVEKEREKKRVMVTEEQVKGPAGHQDTPFIIRPKSGEEKSSCWKRRERKIGTK